MYAETTNDRSSSIQDVEVEFWVAVKRFAVKNAKEN
jgi:hypothetical protein